MEQVIFGGWYDLLDPAATEYNSLVGGYNWTDTVGWRSKLVSTDGVIKNLRVKLSGAPGAGKKYTFALMLNENLTALTFDIADADTIGSNMVNQITVTGGDRIYLRCIPDGTPTAVYAYWTSVFAGDTANESLILGGSGAGLSDIDIEYGQLMCGYTSYSITENDFRQVCPTGGTLKNFYVWLNLDPGKAPDAYRLTLRKNGISQTLTVTITANDTTGSDLVNTVDVVAGDILTLMIEPLNTPSKIPYANWGMTFVADVDGESIVIGGTRSDLDAAATEYMILTGWAGRSWSPDETIRYQLGQVCTLKKLYILLSGSPGAGNDRDFAIRIAGTNVITLQISDAETTGNSGALEDTVALDEYVNLRTIPTSSPDVADAYWGFVCYISLIVVPTVTTQAATGLGIGAGTLHGTITDTGGENADERGFDYDYDSGVPYAISWTETDSFGVGAFEKALTGLTQGETLYFRAKATNSAGWGYGGELSFKVPKAWTKTLTESLGLLDSYSRTWAAYRTYSELLGLKDVVSKEPSKTFAEALGFAESISKGVSKTLTEALGLRDTFSRGARSVSKTLTEVLGLRDTLTGRVCVTFSRFRTLVAGLVRRLRSRI